MRLTNEQIKKMRKRIKDLEKALSYTQIRCEKLNHSIKHRHEASEPCPVEKFINEVLYDC